MIKIYLKPLGIFDKFYFINQNQNHEYDYNILEIYIYILDRLPSDNRVVIYYRNL
jgi:hypothetical protein